MLAWMKCNQKPVKLGENEWLDGEPFPVTKKFPITKFNYAISLPSLKLKEHNHFLEPPERYLIMHQPSFSILCRYVSTTLWVHYTSVSSPLQNEFRKPRPAFSSFPDYLEGLKETRLTLVHTGIPHLVRFFGSRQNALWRKPHISGTDLTLKSQFETFWFSMQGMR